MTKNKTMPRFTFGSDAEIHIYDTVQKKIVSAIDVLKRDKHDPIDLGDGFKCYYDNVLVENSFLPAQDKKEFIGRFKTVFTKMQKILGNRYRFVPKAAHIYDDVELSNPVAQEIGCSPNFDVYREEINMPEPFKDGMRTGSFHLHIGNADYEKANNNGFLLTIDSKNNAIKLLDIFVGCASVLFDKDESSKIRRQIYGKAGEFRTTEYGIEFRPLGNYSLLSPKLVDLVYDLMNHALTYIVNNKASKLLEKIDAEQVQKAINECDTNLATDILKQANLPKSLFDRIMKESKTTYKVEDFYKNWNIKV